MTLTEIAVDVYEGLGEPSDLEIYDALLGSPIIDVTSEGWQRIVDAINSACLAITTWKFNDGRSIKFRRNEAEGLLKTEVLSATLTGTSGSAIVSTTLPVQDADYYASSVVKLGVKYYRILSSQTNGTATDLFLLTAIDADYLDETCVVSCREYHFADATAVAFGQYTNGIGYVPGNGKPLEIISIKELEGETEISQESKYESLYTATASLATPSSFYKITSGLRFDTWPSEELVYAVRYARGPKVLTYTAVDEEPEIPQQFHRCIVLHALWWGYRRAQENDSAYSTKKDFIELLRNTQNEYDLQDTYVNHQISFSMGV